MAKNVIDILLRAQADTSSAKKNLDALYSSLGKSQLPTRQLAELKEAWESANKAVKAYADFTNDLSEKNVTSGDLQAWEKLGQVANEAYRKVANSWGKIPAKSFIKEASKLTNQDILKLQEELKNLRQQLAAVKGLSGADLGVPAASKKINTGLDSAKQSFDKGETAKALEEYSKILRTLESYGKKNTNNAGAYQQAAQSLKEFIKNAEEGPRKMQALESKIISLQNAEFDQQVEDFTNLTTEANKLNSTLANTNKEIGILEAEAKKSEQEVAELVNQFARFTTLAGALRVVTNAIRSAYQAVKELDASMNSIAVVTDKTTKQLWEQIDVYTSLAQKTGSSIKGSYEVAQLYYQQGLTTNEVMTATEETLKMARIAQIDYASATDYATAAIKGFNLAHKDLAHINDVYSNLAAKTAADTEEISIAMSKVASIAHSTGMELETTAAFLTQIIATTREAPETAGTALKTVIARFSEVKELISAGDITGTDEEGEEINVNKIEAALKTAGVQLRDTAGQMRDLDDVFLELASKWESLDTLQQRYIATQAAGSRQQSRFLALMNNYDELMKTVGYATDSAGASNEQFEKTLDSLESKLNALSNAWTEFTTGIANESVIKKTVDLIAQLIEKFNDLTDGSSNITTSLLRLGIVFGSLRGAAKVLGSALVKTGLASNTSQLVKSLGTLQKIDGSRIASIAEALSSFEVGETSNFFKNFTSQLFDTEGIKEAFAKLKKTTFTGDQEIFEVGMIDALIPESLEQLFDPEVIDRYRQSTLAAQLSVQGLSEAERESIVLRWEEQNSIKLNLIAQSKKIAANLVESTSLGKLAAKLAGVNIVNGKVALSSLTTSQAFRVIGISAGMAGLAIGTIIAAGVALYRSSSNFEMKNAQASLNALKEASSEAAEKLEELSKSYDEFNNTQDSFKTLIKGTTEWNETLAETNQQVLDLITKFPQLLKFMTIGEYGQLTISDDGWDKVIKQQKDTTMLSSAGAALAQGKVKELSYDKILKDLDREIQKELNAATRGQQGYVRLDSLLDSSGYIDLTKAQDVLKSSFEEILPLISEYNSSVLAQKNVLESYTKAGVTALVDAEYANEKYINSITDNFARLGAKQATFKAGKFVEAGNYTSLSEAMDDRGVDRRGSRKKNLKALYASLAGIDYESVTLETKDELKYAISQLLAADAMDKSLDDLVGRVAMVNDTVAQAINGVLTEGKEWTSADIEKYSDWGSARSQLQEQATALGYESMDDYAKAIGYDNANALILKMTQLAQEYSTQIKSNIDAINASLNGAITNANIEDWGLTLTYDLSESLKQAFESAGKNGINQEGFAELINTIVPQADVEDRYEVLKALTETDYSNIKSINSLIKSLDDAGIETDGLAAAMIKLGQAAAQIDLEELTKDIEGLGKVSDVLKDRESTEKIFSGEEMAQLIENGLATANQFVMTGIDEYTFIDPMINLTEALQENTAAILKDTYEKIKHEAEIAEGAQQYAEDEGLKEIYKFLTSPSLTYENGTFETATTYTNDENIRNWMSTRGLDKYIDAGTGQIETLDLSNYSGEALAAKFIEQFEKYISGADYIFAQQEQYEATYNPYAGNTNYNNIYSTGAMGENRDAALSYLNAIVSTTPGATEKVKELTEAFVEQGSRIDHLGIKALTMEYKKNQKEIDKVNESLEDNQEALEKAGNDAYNEAIHETTELMQEAFGEHITDDFVKTYIKDIAKMSESQESFDKVMQASGEAFMAQYGDMNGALIQAQQELASLDSTQASVYLSADNSQYLQAIGESTEKANQMVAFYDSIGWSAVLTRDDEGMVTGAYLVRNSGGGTQGYRPSGGGGGGGSKEPAKAEQDPFYNYIKQVEQYENALERLENQWDLITDPKEAKANLDEQEAAIVKVMAANQAYLTEVGTQLTKMQGEMTDKYGKYLSFAEDGSIRLNENYFKATGKIVEEMDAWIDQYDDILGRQTDLNDELDSYKKQLKDMWEGWRDDYIDISDQLAEIYQERDEKALEEKEKYYEQLEEQDEKYLESVRKNIDAERKAREKAKNYEDISQKQKRLALLERDTSGRYTSEVLQLREEIGQSQQDMADQEVDNLLDALEQQNQDEAERHEEILEAMQQQIDENIENREYIRQAEATIAQGDDAILAALMTSEDYLQASEVQRQKMIDEWGPQIGGLQSFLDSGFNTAAGYIEQLCTIMETEMTELAAAVGDISVTVNNYSGGGGGGGGYVGGSTGNPNDGDYGGTSNAEHGYIVKDGAGNVVASQSGFASKTEADEALSIWLQNNDGQSVLAGKGYTWSCYKKGGLVNYTGPAWVDGTPGNPEAFLNPTQTQIIGDFAQYLAKLVNNSGSIFSSGLPQMEGGMGDCNITIEIGSLGADYDIDKAIAKVKDEIVRATSYRGVNILKRTR